ncbi:MAG: choice-of-anchor O protein [Gammaproteobacteria bacterium]|nr:choice-of-anchor O protein [Gammaproteobacteria bacterium]
MCLAKLKSQSIVLVVFPVLCLLAGSVGADQDLTWPVEADLVYNDVDLAQVWHDSGGDAAIWNTKDDLKISINPGEGLRIEEVAIHVVADPADFSAILDKKGRPRLRLFDYQTLYLEETGELATEHLEVIPLDVLREQANICWGIPEKCPPNRYIVIAADLHLRTFDEFGNEVWEKLPETTYAENVAAFDRYPGSTGDAIGWGFYVTYPLAKVEPGHFVDANVNGLAYETVTQSGTTGDNGQFWYLPNEHVAFFVGNLFLGEALGDRAISPAGLFEGADLDDDRVLNVARLLQSFDADGNPAQGAINITEPVIACLNSAMTGLPPIPAPEDFFADDYAVGALIDATLAACAGDVELMAVTKEEARDNLNAGTKAGNLMKRNLSKTPGMKSDKAKIEIVPIYVPALRADGAPTSVVYHDEYDQVIEERFEAKPIVVSYLDEVEGTGSADVFVAISRDDGDTWKRRNLSKTADKSSLLGYPGKSWKPMLKVKDNKIFVAWTDKYCHGGRPGYAINVCPDTTGDGLPDPCDVCRETDEGTFCTADYMGDDVYWQDDLFGVGGPQRSVVYEEFPEMGEIPYSCVWTARAVIEPNGNIQWFKPERLTSGRRDAYQLFAGAGTDVAFAIVWQEDPKGLRPGEGEGPGDGWSGARSSNKTDIWYSYITLDDFGTVDYNYPAGGPGHDSDFVDWDPDLAGRVKALVPMSLPVRVSDNDVCSLENMDPSGGSGEHDYDEEGQGTHRYCGALEGIGTAAAPGTNLLCAYTVEKTNPKGEVHNVCVTADGRLLDGNTGASRANVFLQPYKKPDGTKSAWAIVGYEESKGVGIPPDNEEHDCDTDSEDEHDAKYKPDEGKNVIYHSFDFRNPELVGGGGILNLPETDAAGNPVYVVDEFGALLLDWKGEPQLAYENARRVRFISQPKSRKGPSGTVLVALYRQGEEGKGKPADIFMRRAVASPSGNPYAFGNFVPGVQNISSVEPTLEWQDPFDPEKPVKMLRWSWSPANLADSSAKHPRLDAKAHRGAINGDDLLIGYSWTPNWGRAANDKYDFYVRRSFNGGQSWTTDPFGSEIDHNVVFRVPIEDYDTQTVTWDEEVVTTAYGAGESEPPRNVSNLRNNRTSVLEPRLVKTPGTIKTNGVVRYAEDNWNSSVYQLAFGLEFNQNQLADGIEYPQMPLDIYYSRTRDKGQRYESVVVTPQGGSGKPQDGWNALAKDKPEQGGAQLRQTPDGSRMYSIWLEESEQGSDIMFRRVDYRGVSD